MELKSIIQVFNVIYWLYRSNKGFQTNVREGKNAYYSYIKGS